MYNRAAVSAIAAVTKVQHIIFFRIKCLSPPARPSVRSLKLIFMSRSRKICVADGAHWVNTFAL